MFLQRIQPIICICKIVGCIQFPLDITPNLRTNVSALIFPLPYYLLNVCCIFMIIFSAAQPCCEETNKILEISDLIDFSVTVITFFLRSSYYFIKREQFRNIFLKVSMQAQTAIN